jgi:hypothetical protein
MVVAVRQSGDKLTKAEVGLGPEGIFNQVVIYKKANGVIGLFAGGSGNSCCQNGVRNEMGFRSSAGNFVQSPLFSLGSYSSTRIRFSNFRIPGSAAGSRKGLTSATTCSQSTAWSRCRTILRQLSPVKGSASQPACCRALLSRVRFGAGHSGSLRYHNRS